MPTGGPKSEPIAFQKTRFNEAGGRISPDNKWVAYTSDESGENEVYLKRLASPESDAWKISSDGAFSPEWGSDGTELFYVNRNNQMMLVRLRFAGLRGEAISAKPLFTMPAFSLEYDISPDGKYFVITRSLEMKKFPPMSLVVNWKALINQNKP